MGLTARNTGGDGTYEPVPEGLHHGVCYAIYDLGTQHNEHFNKDMEQVLIIWELPNERMADDRPMSISKKYTNSLHEKAALRKDLESWRGRSFTDAELEGFDLRKLMGANCQLQVNHNTNSKGDKTYANIAAIVPLSRGTKLIKPENPTVIYEIHGEIPESCPEWVEKIILKAQENQPGYTPPAEVPPSCETDVEPF